MTSASSDAIERAFNMLALRALEIEKQQRLGIHGVGTQDAETKRQILSKTFEDAQMWAEEQIRKRYGIDPSKGLSEGQSAQVFQLTYDTLAPKNSKRLLSGFAEVMKQR